MSNADEPPQKTNQPPSSSLTPPSLFSLPVDIVLNILALVPKRYYPILCCVSKSLRSLIRSPEIHKTRSLHGKDSLYLCFSTRTTYPNRNRTTFHWFTLRRNDNKMNTTENVFVSIDVPYRPGHASYPLSNIAIDTEIYCIPGYNFPSSSIVWIFDTQSGQWRQGPSMQVERLSATVGLVGGKIYVIGGNRGEEILAEVFDLKTQTWEAAPIPKAKDRNEWFTHASVSLDRKVYALNSREYMNSYDTRDGSYQRYTIPEDNWWKTGKCVIDNVLFVYFLRFGLMWYDSELMLWRVVYGLDLDKARCIGIGEYYGKLAFIWGKPSNVSESKEIWCRMIGLLRSEVGIHGTEEPSQLLRIVPNNYSLRHCLSLSG
ncbi:Galactose oxidase/kelch repeat superfamily protein [Arabidopsis thaliana]|uniref:F-box/kelch-repeat protein At2g44630 n=1 Tax=Arabidopsis thaliana TaxID=3702 RepID=FBK47_ARATH|nr:Galactose oxidase/kelch repeat superfamily protein [Arabidopsis thaliana]O80502.1 RecName: Full=F-box/kelch-repeat protein At2g44630 [Arabidopsis thaliana]AAC27465.1 hypothetical protein [Arabidopsis thaliana]AAO63962.1 unknown protein [Arabidopsis thaliana]AEC10449.1 Galactose oxidase/kelch repeat superfamily protein [Arabidopsis thaliana]BAC42923.1 unknown protein [Arabidopsis thaliana]|eukprot:NP_181991.1 Galactose oxidase/kelch repeat superfamily protein [Arabidopsis thaliana]